MSREDGVTDAELAALSDFKRSPVFEERARAVLAYAEALTTDNSVSDELFEGIRQCFSEDEIVELTAVISWEICAAKFNRALQIESQGIYRVPKTVF